MQAFIFDSILMSAWFPGHSFDTQTNACDVAYNISMEFQSFYQFNSTNMPINKTCNWKISIPQNYFVYIYLVAELPKISTIIVKARNQLQQHRNRRAFYLTHPGLEIIVETVANVSLNFDITRQNLSHVFSPTYIDIYKSSHAVVLNSEDTYHPIMVRGENQIAIASIAGHFKDLHQYMRATLIFDGPNWNATCIGNAYSIFKSGKMLMPTKRTVTIYTLIPIQTQLRLVIVDKTDLPALTQFHGEYIVASGFRNISLSDSSMLLTVTHSIHDEYLSSMSIDENSRLDVYVGGLTNLIASYNASNIHSDLPQNFRAVVRFYYLNAGSAMLSLTRDKHMARWEHPFAGRRGFFNAHFHDKNDELIEYYDVIGDSSMQFQFSYKILHFDDGLLYVFIPNHHLGVYNASDSTNHQWAVFNGPSMSMFYHHANRGALKFQLDFKIDAINGAKIFSVFICWHLILFYLIM
ncbi:unnamed protein product [Caenorhabditis bovis]|uniref:CUB-like domain-containing protein n=1 Tax=Caenorhabditis bovis TaxID=2654633 RepID=A0A8S1F6I1_9PELO|nr:unnamed protein product [Caenorhabditis bovis]